MRPAILLLLALFLPGPLLGQATPIQDFYYQANKDAMTGSDESLIYTSALNPTPRRQGKLYWRCDDSELNLYVFADKFLNSDDPVDVRWRFDDGEPSAKTTWSVSTNGTAAFAPDHLIPLFTDKAKSAAQVLVRVWDFEGTSYDYRFSMMGLTAGLSRLGCGSVDRYGQGYVTTDEEGQPSAYLPNPDSAVGKAILEAICYEQAPMFQIYGTYSGLDRVVVTPSAGDAPVGDWGGYGGIDDEEAETFARFLSRSDSVLVTFRRWNTVEYKHTLPLEGFHEALQSLSCFP